MKKSIISGFIVVKVLLVLFLLTGCTTNNPYYPPTGTYQDTVVSTTLAPLESFQSVAQYQALASSQTNYFLGGFGGNSYRGDMMETTSLAMPKVATEGSSLPVANSDLGSTPDYSQTNNQVAGVDEADILKTDGQYIYTITEKTVYLLQAYPGTDAKVLGTITFDKYYPRNLFIDNDLLVVIGRVSGSEFYNTLGFQPRSGMMFVNVYDVHDRTNPILEKEFKFEGNYVDARLIGNEMYLVAKENPEVRRMYPTPIVVEGNMIKAMPVSELFYRPIPYDYPQLVMTHALNLQDFTLHSVGITMQSLQTVYVSNDNLYLVGRQYISEQRLREDVIEDLLANNISAVDKQLIEKIKTVDNAILNQQEKRQKILQIFYWYVQSMSPQEESVFEKQVDSELAKRLEAFEYREYSPIVKVSLQHGKPEIVAQGKVPGRLLNQFSLDEYDDVLRVATTISPVWSSLPDAKRKESSNAVWTLDKNLKLLGQLTDLAPGEQMYSTRFVANRLYMVTFKQIDPFFVIDLSNPKQPENMGSLKIVGFSRYLQPYDENYLIGIGRDATDLGRTQGLKISLFDVRDVAHPKEVAKFVTDEKYAQSTAEYEHKAFLFSKKKHLLVIPVYNYNYHNVGETYNGAFVFNISTSAITLRGLIDHSGSLDSSYYYRSGVERSLYIDNLLYTKSPHLLRINDLSTLASVKNVTLKKDTAMKIY